MASAASTINNSSAVAPRGLKKLTMKLRAKLEKTQGSVHKKKTSANTGEAVIEPKHSNEQVQNTIMNLKAAEEGSQKVNNPGTRQKHSKKEKAEKRAARKEARKAKWAARRAAFKAKAHKVGEAMFIPVAVVCGIVFGPVILAFDVCLCAFKAVVWLVVQIANCLSAPFVACFYFCR